MGKKLVIYIFLLITVMSGVVFYVRDTTSDQAYQPGVISSPVLIMEDFSLKKYDNFSLRSSISGQLARYIDRGQLEVFGDFRSVNFKGLEEEHLTAESATLFFEDNGITQLFSSFNVKKAEFYNSVRFQTGTGVVTSNFVGYYPLKDTMESDVPTKLTSENGEATGNGGFSYKISKKKFLLHGPIKGFFRGAEKNL